MRSAAANRLSIALLGEKPCARRCSYLVPGQPRGYCLPMLFQPPHEELSDEEIAAVLRQSIASAGRLPRHADVSLAGCAPSIWWTASGPRDLSWRGRCSGGCIREKDRQVVSLAGAAATEKPGDLPNAEERSDPDQSPSSRRAGGPRGGA